MSSKIFALLSITLIAIGILFVRAQFAQTKPEPGQVYLEGSVQNDPRQKGQSVYFKFQGYTIRTLVYPKISYADVIRVSGEANEDGFIAFPEIEKIDRQSNLNTFLFSFRSEIEGKINKFLPEPQASLLTGVLLGTDKGLPTEFEENLRKTGTIHVVVVSGYNILVVGGFFLLLAGFIKRKYAITLSILAIIFYTLLTGAQPPTVRAAIMGSLAFSATLLGRQNLPFYSLLLAAFVMLLVNPDTISDIGFQLSFMATAGIILFKDHVAIFLKRLPSPFGEDLTTTLSAQVLVIPIIFFHFGEISIISPLVNALVLWTVPLATVLGFVIALLAFVFDPLAQIVAWIAWVPLSLFIWVVDFFAQAPLVQVQIPQENVVLLAAYYLVLVLAIFIPSAYERLFKEKSN